MGLIGSSEVSGNQWLGTLESWPKPFKYWSDKPPFPGEGQLLTYPKRKRSISFPTRRLLPKWNKTNCPVGGHIFSESGIPRGLTIIQFEVRALYSSDVMHRAKAISLDAEDMIPRKDNTAHLIEFPWPHDCNRDVAFH